MKITSIIDTKTGKEIDHTAVRKERWAEELYNIDGIAIDDEGNVIVLDSCGNYRYAPLGRFKIELTAEYLK